MKRIDFGIIFIGILIFLSVILSVIYIETDNTLYELKTKKYDYSLYYKYKEYRGAKGAERALKLHLKKYCSDNHSQDYLLTHGCEIKKNNLVVIQKDIDMLAKEYNQIVQECLDCLEQSRIKHKYLPEKIE